MIELIIKEANQKSMLFVTIGISYIFSNVCNGYHDLLVMCMILGDIATIVGVNVGKNNNLKRLSPLSAFTQCCN